MTKTSFVSGQCPSDSSRVCDLFGSQIPSKVLFSSEDDDYDGISEDDDDYYSPTSWDRDPEESDEDYRDRMEDQESLLEYFS